ncbi:NAD(+) synthase [Tepidibacter formicigenes]|jgi:NAD+ synthase|uniref:NH(3)-dependent NAD(+) synthetase n=1 Tax=Tepidibacter formicigenes DSM 15518 TaxID=1123349 RepID=A0A1M6RYF1_9FIRM|nr:NAD(+) synthase [Tepidibacter formicigenes]SHK37481.1 NAD+ synthase [Tepidibacter formicigenes DSM 15518]
MLTIEQKIEKTVDWLREQVKISNTNGLIVGISGGIDSALVTFLIKKAFPENSIGVIMPIKSNPKDREDALKVVKASKINHLDLDLTDVHSLLFNKVVDNMKEKNLYKEENNRIADANLRARIRMSTLYTVANNLNYLVVGTDNAAEVYTGYFTKYGDGGVDILPIANLSKREVYEWAKILGVPDDVINRPPSAGLWEGQTDENEMGTTYDMIDDLIEGKEIPQKDKEIIERLHKKSEHKRVMPPKPPMF